MRPARLIAMLNRILTRPTAASGAITPIGRITANAGHSDQQPAKPSTSDPAPAPSETPSITWKHHPEPVSDEELEQDKTKCENKGTLAPVGAGSPEFKFYLLFSECMRTAGYELVPPPQ
jgi:hypothetical protein